MFTRVLMGDVDFFSFNTYLSTPIPSYPNRLPPNEYTSPSADIPYMPQSCNNSLYVDNQ